MRWFEIANPMEIPESIRDLNHSLMEGNTLDDGRQEIMNVLAPLRSQGVTKVTVDQVLDIISNSPELSGLTLDATFVMDATKNLKLVNKIQVDPEANGAMTIYMDTPVGDRQVDAKQAEKEQKQINKAAMRTLSRKNK